MSLCWLLEHFLLHFYLRICIRTRPVLKTVWGSSWAEDHRRSVLAPALSTGPWLSPDIWTKCCLWSEGLHSLSRPAINWQALQLFQQLSRSLFVCLAKVLFLTVFFLMFIYFERERASLCMWLGGAEREGERESQAGSALSAQSLMRGPNSQTVRS